MKLASTWLVRTISLLLLLGIMLSSPAGAQDLRCLTDAQRKSQSLYAALQRDAYKALDRRLQTFAKLKTKKQIQTYQEGLRREFVSRLGGFPERSPLNSRTVGVIKADGYTIEKVIYDSQPRHRITANLYLPQGKGPFPGVVISSGHSRTAKTADYNQRYGIMMARHGMAALCFDPIGQGERSQILDENGKVQFGSTTTEHFLIGVGSVLVGRNTARYRIWDAMRSIDYLVSRKEINARKIGMAGCSGGGTLTSYVMALDDRVVCAAPSCYLTTFRRLIETIGPQDAEQNIFGQLAIGLDQPDYVLLRAPKPTLISSTTGDFFDIRGTWENYRQAKQIYSRLGFPERVALVEIEGGHGVKPQNLATTAHWMKRWLVGRDEPISLASFDSFKTLPPKKLWCTPTGQVLHTKGELSVLDLNRRYAAQMRSRQIRDADKFSTNGRRQLVRRRLGVQTRIRSEFKKLAVIQRNGHTVEKLIVHSSSSVPLPTLIFRPKKANNEFVLLLHDLGKTAAAGKGGRISQLVKDGTTVVTADLSGQGETAQPRSRRRGFLGDWKDYSLAYLLGRSLAGIRVQDTIAVANAVRGHLGAKRLRLSATGSSRIIAVHAAALAPNLFQACSVKDLSWTDAAGLKNPSVYLDSAIHGVLQTYDLPDLKPLMNTDKR